MRSSKMGGGVGYVMKRAGFLQPLGFTPSFSRGPTWFRYTAICFSPRSRPVFAEDPPSLWARGRVAPRTPAAQLWFSFELVPFLVVGSGAKRYFFCLIGGERRPNKDYLGRFYPLVHFVHY